MNDYATRNRIMKEKRQKDNLAVIKEYKLLSVNDPKYTKLYNTAVEEVSKRRNRHLKLVEKDTTNETNQ